MKRMWWVDASSIGFDEGTIYVRATKIGEKCKTTDPVVAQGTFTRHEDVVAVANDMRDICDRWNLS